MPDLERLLQLADVGDEASLLALARELYRLGYKPKTVFRQPVWLRRRLKNGGALTHIMTDKTSDTAICGMKGVLYPVDVRNPWSGSWLELQLVEWEDAKGHICLHCQRKAMKREVPSGSQLLVTGLYTSEDPADCSHSMLIREHGTGRWFCRDCEATITGALP